jgi:tellurite resistance protein
MIQRLMAAPGRPGLRIPPNLFGIAFGLAGLAEAWHAAGPLLGVPRAVPAVIDVVAAGVWLALVLGYAAQGPRQVLADLRDPVLAPFVPVAAITAMILSASLASYAPGTGRVLVIVFLTLTIATGGWLTGQWITGDLDTERVHPGYFLPTVAGGLIGAFAAAQVGLHAVAEASFGIGVICWLLLGSIVLNRLFFRRWLPDPLVPTLAIELAPPAVAGLAYFALTGGATNMIAAALGGYTVLMALVQLRFVPRYTRLKFSPGFWAFTFSYAAATTDALKWVTAKRPPAAAACASTILAALTVLVAAIAVRTVIAAHRGQLFPARQPAAVAGLEHGTQRPAKPVRA